MKISSKLRSIADSKKAKILQSFFKTKKGEYGEGDLFLGIPVPRQRELVNAHWKTTNIIEIKKLLYSRFHEERLTALLILIKKYDISEKESKKSLIKFYLDNLSQVNNWDLVDLSAPNLLGNFLLDKTKKILYKLVISKNLWERRIAIVSTIYFIRKDKFEDTLKISKLLLKDKEDLIHKAVGWMLREVGKRDISLLREFLDENKKNMPRTSLRYAIERMSLIERQRYLSKQ